MDPDVNIKHNNGIDSLPEEILEYIISLVSPYRDLKSASLVCKRWYYITTGVARKKAEDILNAVNMGQLEWRYYPKDLGPTITERYSHSAAYHNKSVYVFGGCTATNTTFNDLWRFDLALKQWIRPLAMGSYPSPKACASLVTYKGSLILFGGWSHPTPYPLHQAARYFNQLHIYCPITNRWSCVPSTNVPAGKAGHSASIVGDTMVVFGGSQRDSLSCNDIWVLELGAMCWKRQETGGKLPLPRYGHGMFILDDKHLLLVGGCGGPNMQFTDVWVLDMTYEIWRWTEITVEGKDYIPPQLWFHPLCKVGDRLVVVSKALHPPVTPEPVTKSTTHSLLTTQLAQMRRTLPDTSTSESSSQDSSSDTDDINPAGAAGQSDVRPRTIYYRNTQAKSNVKNHSCRKCGNHWDVCVCTEDCVNPVPRNNPMGNPMDNQMPGTSSGTGAVPRGEAVAQFRVPFRSQRGMPSIKPNASKNRQKQLETLRKYEEKFRNKMSLAAEEIEMKVQRNTIEFVRNSPKKPQNPMYVHTLDIRRVLTGGIVTWQPIHASSGVNAPDETIFYSLVEGRGELVMFGGVHVDMNTMQRGQGTETQTVNNTIHFLRPATVLR